MRQRPWVSIAVLAFAVTSRTGCFWLAVGGAGVAGYEIGKDDRSIGTKLDDASITTSVKAKFVKDSQINALDYQRRYLRRRGHATWQYPQQER